MQSDLTALLASFSAAPTTARAPKLSSVAATAATPKPIKIRFPATDIAGRPIGFSEPLPERYKPTRGNTGATFAPFTYTQAGMLYYPPNELTVHDIGGYTCGRYPDLIGPYRNRSTFEHPYDTHQREQRAMRNASERYLTSLAR